MHAVVREFEVDDAAVFAKAGRVSHGQDGFAAEPVEDSAQHFLFRGTDKNNLTASGSLTGLEPPDDEEPPVDGFALDGLIERRPEGVMPKHADAKRRTGGQSGPLDEAGKLVKHGGLARSV